MPDEDERIYYRNVTVRLSTDVDKRVIAAAKAAGVSVAKYIEDAVAKATEATP